MSDRQQWRGSGSRPWQSQNRGHRQWGNGNRQSWQPNHQAEPHRHQHDRGQINPRPYLNSNSNSGGRYRGVNYRDGRQDNFNPETRQQQYNAHQYDESNSHSQFERHQNGHYYDSHYRNRRQETQSSRFQNVSQNFNQEGQPNRFQNENRNQEEQLGSFQNVQGAASASTMSDTIMSSRDEATEKQTKTFQEMNRLENTEYQLSSANYDIDQVPVEIKEGVNDFDDSDKDIAVKHAITMATRKMKAIHIDDDEDDDGDDDEEDDDDDDNSNKSDFSYYKDEYDDGAPYSKKQKKEYMYSDKQLSEFFNGLRKNLVFDMGFRVNGIYTNVEKNCWCPCGRHMSAWRGQFDLEYLAGKGSEVFCESSAKMVPSGLMSHLRTKGETCPLHYGTSEYLMKLYGKLRGTGHKALFCQGDAKYKAAEAAENREKNELLNRAIQGKKEAERREHELKMEVERRDKEKEELMTKLKASNPDRFKEVRDLDDMFQALKISDEAKEAEIDKKKLLKFTTLVDKTFEYLCFGISRKKIDIFIEQKINEQFDINNVFAKMEKKKDGLFKNVNLERFALDWEVHFSAYDNTEDMRARDEGGPTREFFTLVWKNLGNLSVLVKSKTKKNEPYKINLFDSTPGGLTPLPDDFLEDRVKRAIDETHTNETLACIMDRIKNYYRAVGIILFRAITSGNIIAHYVMPNFYRNVFLLNIEPKDVGQYSKKQMLIHLKEIDFNYQDEKEGDGSELPGGTGALAILNKTVKELKQIGILDENTNGCDNDDMIINEEKFFSFFLQHSIIDKQTIAINAIKKGLSLYEKKTVEEKEIVKEVDLPATLSMTSLKFISERFFAAPKIEAEDLIERLIFIAESDDSEVMKIQKDLKDIQDIFFHITLKEVIREMDNDDLESFTSFCTGFNYLPQRHQKGEFKIKIEFNVSEMEEMSLPVAHTCVNILKLPAQAYGNDKKVFLSKLHTAMKNSKGFSMG